MSLLRFAFVVLASLFLFSTLASSAPGYDHDEWKHDDKKKDHDDDWKKHHPDDWKHHPVHYPKCHYKWKWTYNKYHHNPCKVAAHLISKCRGEKIKIEPLKPGECYKYDDWEDHCRCNTVIYNLISACIHCQGGKVPCYKDWVRKCKKVWPPKRCPVVVPHGTSVHHWAFNDVNNSTDTWDPESAGAAGVEPEVCEGTKLDD